MFPGVFRGSPLSQVPKRRVGDHVQARARDEERRAEREARHGRLGEVLAAAREFRAHQRAVHEVERYGHQHHRDGGVAHAPHERVVHRAVQVVRPPHREARVRERARGCLRSRGVGERQEVAAVEERQGQDHRARDLLHEPSEPAVDASSPAVPHELTVRRAHEEQHGEGHHPDRDPPERDIRVLEHPSRADASAVAEEAERHVMSLPVFFPRRAVRCRREGRRRPTSMSTTIHNARRSTATVRCLIILSSPLLRLNSIASTRTDETSRATAA